MSSLESIFPVLRALATVILILILAYVVTKYIAGHVPGGGSRFRKNQITVLDQVIIGKDQKLLLVRMKEQIYFLGVAQGSISCLEKLPAESFSQEASEHEFPEKQSFSQALQQVIKQRRK